MVGYGEITVVCLLLFIYERQKINTSTQFHQHPLELTFVKECVCGRVGGCVGVSGGGG